MRKLPTLAIAAAAIVALSPQPDASADQLPRGLLRNADKGCTIDVTPVSFGEYDVFDTRPLTGLGNVIYTCGEKDRGDVREAIKNIRITISRGLSGSFSDRTMVAPGLGALHYNLYLDANYRTIWGDGTSGSEYYLDPHPPNKKPVTVPIYARIQPFQDIAVGAYSDTLEVTIQF
jgi:spore coat protein U-like protein